jgi:hypothetical protein
MFIAYGNTARVKRLDRSVPLCHTLSINHANNKRWQVLAKRAT